MKVIYHCPFAQQTGYSRAAADYLMALRTAGVDLTVGPLYPYDGNNIEEGYEDLLKLFEFEDPLEVTHVVVHSMPIAAGKNGIEARRIYPSAKLVCITTWETSRLPRAISDGLRVYDKVIVPSHHVFNAFAEVDLPCEVVEHCFDPASWYPEPRDVGSWPYVFYTIGADSQRKNLEGLIKAYLTGFTSEDSVILRIHAGAGVLDKVNAIKAQSGLPEGYPFPTIEMTDGSRLTMDDLLEFHLAGDCFVTLSRGEGWGLGAFEAALVGNDVISSKWGGPMHFLPQLLPPLFPPYDSPLGYADVSGHVTPIFAVPEIVTRNIGLGGTVIPITGSRVALPEGVDATQCWFEPDLVAARSIMQSLVSARLADPDVAGQRRYEAAMKVHGIAKELYGYENIGRKLARCLEDS